MKIKDYLISEILKIAKIYLLELDVFYPFGIVYSKKGMRIIGLEDSDLELETLPTSIEIQNRVTDLILNEFENKKTLGIGLAIHTEFVLKNGKKIDPIEIRLIFGDGEEYFTYFEYIRDSKGIVFTENPTPYMK